MVGAVGGLGERVGGLFIESSKYHQYYIGLCRTITSPPFTTQETAQLPPPGWGGLIGGEQAPGSGLVYL